MTVALSWTPFALVVLVALRAMWRGLVEWQGKNGALTVFPTSSLAVIGAFGALAYAGLGMGGGVIFSGGQATGTAAAAEYGAPNTPTHDAVVFAPTGDSLRILGSAFVGSLDDTHDSTAIQVDTAGGDFSSPQYFNDTIAGVITDTIPALDSGAVVVSRIAYKGANGGWSAWSDSLSTTMRFGLDTIGAFTNEPAGFTLLSFDAGDTKDWGGWRNGNAQWDTGTVNGGPPTVVADATCPVFNEAVEFRWQAGDNGPGSNKFHFEDAFEGQDSIYVAYWYYIGVGHDLVKKWFYVGKGDMGDPVDYYLDHGDNVGSFSLVLQGNAGGTDRQVPDVGVVANAGEWTFVETLWGRESVLAAGDGTFDLWAADTLVVSMDTVRYTSGGEAHDSVTRFGGVTWYEYASTGLPDTEIYARICGLKVSGKRN